MRARDWFWRAFDEMEREQDDYLIFVERFERYKEGEGGTGRGE